jgi:hypothetical protein
MKPANLPRIDPRESCLDRVARRAASRGIAFGPDVTPRAFDRLAAVVFSRDPLAERADLAVKLAAVGCHVTTSGLVGPLYLMP